MPKVRRFEFEVHLQVSLIRCHPETMLYLLPDIQDDHLRLHPSQHLPGVNTLHQ